MDEDIKKESLFKDNPIIILLIVIILFIIGYIVYKYLIKKTDNNSGNVNSLSVINTPIPKITSTPIKLADETYVSSDSKFKLVIKESSCEDAKIDFEKTGIDLNSVSVRAYAYFNDTIFGINNINEDDEYILYQFIPYPNEDYGKKVIVNRNTKRIEVPKEILDNTSSTCISNGFCGFLSNPSFINTVIGYFFINEENGLISLYTTNWKKLGYVNLDLSNDLYSIEGLDESGVIVYSDYVKKDNNDGIFKYDLLNGTKYNNKGEIVS